ncbi:unnamed protein product [Microthlaspi erraticum]|uniref:LRAT domain-containing protein n=1 Tax=Microthlaspi erraticum TaxID=1685480 RepID=A0A6D2HJ09_9BRAS|nr:unnamed protein product [Microthlaspi erraticum]
MGILSNKISRDDLKQGDHIYSWRSAYIYAHHGIYVGAGQVIHFTRGGGLEMGTGTFLDKIIVSSVPNHGGDNPCPNCGDQSSLHGVLCSCLDCFLAGGNLNLFEYGVSKAIFLAKQRGGTCTTAPSGTSDEVIHRASFLLTSKNGFGLYDLLENNCEDFAIYCKTGLLVLQVTKLGSSGQANSLCAAGGVFSFTLKFLRTGKSGQAASTTASRASMVSAASKTLSFTLGFVVPGFGATALAGYGVYSIGRLFNDIGMRSDVHKVPVEDIHLTVASTCKTA